MTRSRLTLLVLVAAPAVLAALVGLTHPMRLDASTAEHWRDMHIALIFVFPLIGLAPWLVARRVDRRLGWIAAVAGYGFATLYTALDILAGVAGGALWMGGQSDATGPVFEIARVLARIGVWSLVVGAVVAGAGVIWHVRRRGLGLVALAVVGLVAAAVGAWLIYDGHIYVPKGTIAMLLTASGFAVLAIAVTAPGVHDDRPDGAIDDTSARATARR